MFKKILLNCLFFLQINVTCMAFSVKIISDSQSYLINEINASSTILYINTSLGNLANKNSLIVLDNKLNFYGSNIKDVALLKKYSKSVTAYEGVFHHISNNNYTKVIEILCQNWGTDSFEENVEKVVTIANIATLKTLKNDSEILIIANKDNNAHFIIKNAIIMYFNLIIDKNNVNLKNIFLTSLIQEKLIKPEEYKEEEVQKIANRLNLTQEYRYLQRILYKLKY